MREVVRNAMVHCSSLEQGNAFGNDLSPWSFDKGDPM